MNLGITFTILKQSFHAWSEDNISRWSAALSYYTVFSIAPLLLIAISIAGLIFGTEVASGALFHQISGLLGEQAASTIQTIVQNTNKQSTNIITSVIGIITLLLGASGVFGQLKEALNHIWKVERKPSIGIWAIIRDRFLSFSMVLVIGFLLLVSLVLSAGISTLNQFFSQYLPFSRIFLEGINFLVSLGIVTVLFAAIFKVLPDVRLGWKDVLVGGLVTSILFTIGKTALGIYIGQSGFTSTYGAAAALIIELVWVYYTTQILLFGAEFTKVQLLHQGRMIHPNTFAISKQHDERRIWQKVPSLTMQGYLGGVLGIFITTFIGRLIHRAKSI
jgi:membrane protein